MYINSFLVPKFSSGKKKNKTKQIVDGLKCQTIIKMTFCCEIIEIDKTK